MKKLTLALLTAVSAFALTACGEKAPAQENNETSAQPESSVVSSKQEESKAEKGYVFVYEGVTVAVDAPAEETVAKLGEPVSYFEAASCAFEGLDKMYTYNSVEIDTYPTDNGDRISNILLKDDTVETPEGVSLFETKADMIAAYGENYTEENGMIVYAKDGMKLCFILEGDEIVSIEYVSTVLE